MLKLALSFSGTTGSPKKKPSVLRTSSRDGAKVLGAGRLLLPVAIETPTCATGTAHNLLVGRLGNKLSEAASFTFFDGYPLIIF